MLGRMQTDPVDRTLLELLQRNARTPTTELARRLGLSRTTVQGRIDRLERLGVITGYTIRIRAQDTDAMRAHVMITIAPRHAKAVERALGQLAHVRALHAVSGPVDLIAILGAETPEALNGAIDTIGGIEGVERTTTAIILSTPMKENPL
jgi:DNA-binding Lrp family transcriptional regulator